MSQGEPTEIEILRKQLLAINKKREKELYNLRNAVYNLTPHLKEIVKKNKTGTLAIPISAGKWAAINRLMGDWSPAKIDNPGANAAYKKLFDKTED